MLGNRIHRARKAAGLNQRELAEQAKYAIPTGSPKEVCPLGVTPTTSTTVMSVIGDILVVLLMKKIKFTKAEYAKRHHGGYIGEILTSP